MNHLAKSSKYFLLGVLMYPVLMNVMVFLSPLYSQLVYGKGTEHYQDLKQVARMILPFFSIFYLIGAYHLSKLTGMFGKFILLVLSSALVLSYTLSILIPNLDAISIWTILIRIDYLFLTAALIIIFNFCRISIEVNETV